MRTSISYKKYSPRRFLPAGSLKFIEIRQGTNINKNFIDAH